jgi:hypothetical protein
MMLAGKSQAKRMTPAGKSRDAEGKAVAKRRQPELAKAF